MCRPATALLANQPNFNSCLSMTELSNVLSNLAVADQTIRHAAEERYKELKENSINELALSLMHCVGELSLESHIRILSAVLLRRLLIEEQESAYRQMSSVGQKSLLTGLLVVLENELDQSMKTRICDIVGELASYVLDDSEWPELLPYTYKCLQSPRPLDREAGLGLLGMLSGSLITLLSSPENLHVITSIFQTCLADPSNDGRLILASVRSLCSILTSFNQESALENFQCLMSSLMNALTLSREWAATSSGDILSCGIVECLIDLAEEKSFFFNSQLSAVFDVVMGIIESSATSASLRHLLIEFLVTFATQSPKAARKMRSNTSYEKFSFVTRLFAVCVKMMVMLPDDPHWVTSETPDEDSDGMLDSDVGETAMDRVAQALGVRSTFGIMSNMLGQLLTSGTWQEQHTGLRVMGNYLEVSAKITNKSQMNQHRAEVVATLLTYTQSSHPRVKAASYYAMSQLLTLHGKDLNESQVTLLLERILTDSSAVVNAAPRVRRQVLVSLINLIDCAPRSMLENKLGSVLQQVTTALTEGPVCIQECCVLVLISLTETFKGSEQLLGYYDALMPILKGLFVHAQSKGLDTLWGQTIECCAMLGESSGKAKFYPDAVEMMNMLASLQTEVDASDDQAGVRKYLMKAWVRIARCLEAEFLPYLKMVMSKLLAAVTQDVTEGTGDIDLDDLDDHSDVHMVETEDGCWMAVRTSAVEEQSSACQLIVLLVERLQEHFYPFVEETVRAIAPLLLKSPHEDVRSFCMVAMPELVRATAKATLPDRTPLCTLSEFVLGQLVHSVEKEATLDLIMTAMQAMKFVLNYSCSNWQTLSAAGSFMTEPPALTPETSIPILNSAQMDALTQCTKFVLKDSLQRRAVLRAEVQVSGTADDEDAADEQVFLQESMELHFNISDLIGTILKTHGASYMPVYTEQWHAIVCDLTRPFCLKEDKQFAFFVVCDVIEYGLLKDDEAAAQGNHSATASSYFAELLPAVIEVCGSCKEASPRQACAYALGVAAQKHPVAFRVYAAGGLDALSKCIALGEDEDDEDSSSARSDGSPTRGPCSDNAVASVGVILQAMETIASNALPFASLWPQWLALLPLRHDHEEGLKTLRQLMGFVRSRQVSVVGTPELLAIALKVLLTALHTSLSTAETNQEILMTVHLLRVGSSALSQQEWSSVMQCVGQDLAAKLGGGGGNTSLDTVNSSPGSSAPIHDVLFRW